MSLSEYLTFLEFLKPLISVVLNSTILTITVEDILIILQDFNERINVNR
jgi:hypothetical protein